LRNLGKKCIQNTAGYEKERESTDKMIKLKNKEKERESIVKWLNLKIKIYSMISCLKSKEVKKF